MHAEIYIQTFINGLLLGGVYSLVAIGLTLIYGVMVIVNFAHGEFLMLGMYFAFWSFHLLGLHPYASAILVAASLFLIGILIERILIEPILNAPSINQILLTVGLSTLIIGLVQLFWRAEPRSIVVPISDKTIRFLGLYLNMPRLIAFISSIVVTILSYQFLMKTATGKAIRACSQSRPAAMLMGINVSWIYMLTMGIGAALTGLAGVLMTPSYPIFPTIGGLFSVSAFVIVVLGSMGNFLGAFYGSLIIGVAEAFGGLFIGSEVRQVVSLAIFILVLLLKPQGLFGARS